MNKNEIQLLIEELKKQIDRIAETIKDIDDEKTKQKALEVKQKAEDIIEQAISKLKKLSNNLKESDDVKEVIEYITKKTSILVDNTIEKIKQLKENETIKSVYVNTKNNIEDFLAKPEVNEKVMKAKEVTNDIAEKGKEAIKAWLNPGSKGDK